MRGPPNYNLNISKGFYIINHPIWGSPMLGNPRMCTLNLDLPINTGIPHCANFFIVLHLFGCMEALGPADKVICAASNTSTQLLSSQDIPRISQDTGTVIVKTKPQQELKPLAGSGQTVSTSCSLSCCSPPARWGSADFIRVAFSSSSFSSFFLNCHLQISVGIAGPQPLVPDLSGHGRARCQGECQIDAR